MKKKPWKLLNTIISTEFWKKKKQLIYFVSKHVTQILLNAFIKKKKPFKYK